MTLPNLPPVRYVASAVLLLLLSAGAPALADEPPSCQFAERAKALDFGEARKARHGGRTCRGAHNTWHSTNAHEGALYRIGLPATTPVEISVTSADFPPTIRIFDADGVLLTDRGESWVFKDSEFRPTTAEIPITLPAGTYYVAVEKSQFLSNRPLGDRYEIRLRKLDIAVDAGSGGRCNAARDAARRAPLALDGRTVSAQLGAADCFEYGTYHHHYRLSLPTRRTVALQAMSSAFRPQVSVQYASGDYVQNEDDADDSDGGIETELPAGDYIVQVRSETLGNFTGGQYRLTARTVGAPSADSSRLGAICGDDPESVDVGTGEQILLRGVLTDTSCKLVEQPYHTYTFELTEPQRVIIGQDARRKVALVLKGPSGVVPPNRPSYGQRRLLDRVLEPGRYTIGLMFDRDEPSTGKGRFEVPMLVVGLVTAGQDGADCRNSDFRPIRPGQSVEGALTRTSCRLPISRSKFASEVYALDLQQAQEVSVELTADGFRPILLVSTPTGGTRGESVGASGAQRARVALPAGRHVIAVVTNAAGQIGAFRLTVSAPE